MNKVSNIIDDLDLTNIEKTDSIELAYALQNDRIVYISDVPKGLECNCTCPHCGNTLIAKKGSVREHHFAHYNSIDCGQAGETALHLFAKQILAEQQIVQLPDCLSSVNLEDLNGVDHFNQDYLSGEMVHLKEIQTEPKLNGYQPDLTAIINDHINLDIEIKVTHAVDEQKSNAQANRKKEMIEIDLSNLARDSNPEVIKNAVLFTAPRTYIYSEKQNELNLHTMNRLEITINYINSLISKANSPDLKNILDATENNQVVLTGFKFGGGFSTKYQSHFKVGHLFFSKPVQSKDTANFSIKKSGGYEIDKIEADESLISELEKLNFPIKAKLEYEARSDIGKRPKWIVCGIKI
jgi:hypothetical protein